MADILSSLNEQQREAVTTTEGPVLILAGAGSGKTRVITHRIASLIDVCGVPPHQILAVTFTNKAAEEMQNRVQALLPVQSDRLWLRTFHSTGVRILREIAPEIGISPHFVIYDEKDQLTMIKTIIKESESLENVDPSIAQRVLCRAKEHLLLPDDYQASISNVDRSDTFSLKKQIAELYCVYEERMQKAGALDFEDLLMRTVLALRSHPALLERYQKRWRYIMIDEYQDTNHAQYTLANLLARSHRNLCVVGDDDQSIYSWRGADISNILNFEMDYPEALVVKLELNYRSTQNILTAASGVVSHNIMRKNKTLWCNKGEGNLITVRQCKTGRAEAYFVAETISILSQEFGLNPGDCAVFYRINAQSRAFEEALGRYGLNYIVVGGVGFYQRKEIKDILAYLKFMFNPADEISFRRIVNVPKRGIGSATVEKILTAALQRELWDVLDAPEEYGISRRIAAKLEKFTSLMRELKAQSEGSSLYYLIAHIVERTGYAAQFQNTDDIESASRLANLEELAESVKEFEAAHPDEGLENYLEYIALVSNVDRWDKRADVVSLMTLHNAKGLEFPVVFMTGMEEGLFPWKARSGSAGDEDAELEEERRLCYVGITRAMERLYCTFSESAAALG